MRFFMCIAAMILCAGALAAETRIVSTTSEGKTKTYSTEVREIPDGSGVEIQEKGEEGSFSVHLDGDGLVRSVETQSKDGTILMVSDGKFVTVSGTWKGKAVGGKCDQKGLGFYGSGFEFALRALARGGLESLRFPMINPAEPSKAVVMELTREGSESYKGRDAIKVKIGLTGIMAAFWSAHLLVGGDGMILKYMGNQGPGTPYMETALLEVKP